MRLNADLCIFDYNQSGYIRTSFRMALKLDGRDPFEITDSKLDAEVNHTKDTCVLTPN